MADTTLKRSHPGDGGDQETKRSKSNTGSPIPTSMGGKPNFSDMLAQAKAKAEAIKARSAALNTSKPTPATTAPATGQSASDRLAAMRARVAAATSRVQPARAPTYETPVREDDLFRARGGLGTALHPSLLGDNSADKNKSKDQQRSSTGFGNRNAPRKAQLDLSGPSVEELKQNPYFDANISVKNVSGKGRQSRQLVFNQQGKYIQQAAALRRQAQLEAMKKRIAERARQAGIEEELDNEKAFVVQSPPDIEWWDEGLISGGSYEKMGDPINLKIDTSDSIITIYVQHPVLIEPPQAKNMPAPKPMYLTSKEQAKLRRQRRMADLKEEQAKIRLGLVEPPPPKVKKSNLMRVLGEQAIQDPTAVEARVNREIAERKEKHETVNEERKLTRDQKSEKLQKQQELDVSKGIYQRVYRIDSLANGKHRYQISQNAKEDALTGVCILHPRMNLVIVEGGEHSIRHYDKLMQNRIKWQEMEAPKSVQDGNREHSAKWLEAEDENGDLRDLSSNRCDLVFAGQAKQRSFRTWLGARVCEGDRQVKDVLTKGKMESMWNVAKGFKTDM